MEVQASETYPMRQDRTPDHRNSLQLQIPSTSNISIPGGLASLFRKADRVGWLDASGQRFLLHFTRFRSSSRTIRTLPHGRQQLIV
jgi:hypothetical protein